MKKPDDIIKALIDRHNKHTNNMRDHFDNAFNLEGHYQNACEVEYCVLDITEKNSSYQLWFFEQTKDADLLFSVLNTKAIDKIKRELEKQ